MYSYLKQRFFVSVLVFFCFRLFFTSDVEQIRQSNLLVNTHLNVFLKIIKSPIATWEWFKGKIFFIRDQYRLFMRGHYTFLKIVNFSHREENFVPESKIFSPIVKVCFSRMINFPVQFCFHNLISILKCWKPWISEKFVISIFRCYYTGFYVQLYIFWKNLAWFLTGRDTLFGGIEVKIWWRECDKKDLSPLIFISYSLCEWVLAKWCIIF